MSARRRQGSPDPRSPKERSLLRIPLAQAKAEIEERIDAGRELARTPLPSLEGDTRAGYVVHGSRAWRPAITDCPELDAHYNKVSQWRDYNQTWLDRNLGGEAAEEYEAACQHWGSAMADDPVTRLRYLREDIGREIAKLESILGRLPLWTPEADTASSARDSTAQPPANQGTAAHHHSSESATDFAANRKAVMVIYGHDNEANDALFDWLRAIGLEPREWTQLVQATESGSPYIGQILDRAFTKAQAVVALFTPDERVIARTADTENKNAWRLQARPNVLIEAGMALVTHPTRTVLVTLGDMDLPSDLAGRHYIRLSHTDPKPLHDLASRLQTAGCETDTTGAQWLDPSRFPDRAHSSRSPQDARPAAKPEPGSQSREPADTEAQAKEAERRTRQDTDARHVTVSIKKADTVELRKQGITHLITVTSPTTYPIKQVEGQIAWQTNNGGLAMTGFGYSGDPPRAENGQIQYAFKASLNPQILNPEPIIRFVDQHGTRYYQFRLHTQRFPATTDWTNAARIIDIWLRTGPNPD